MSQEVSSNPTPKPYPEADSSSQEDGKVTEGLATSGYTAVKKSIARPHLIAGVAVTDEVWRFAATNELHTHLEIAVQIVRQSFQKTAEMSFTYDLDPEIENESYITMHAKLQGTLEDLVKEHQAYMKAIVRAIPANKLPLISFAPEVI